ncbi:MAG: hypothetical protein ACRDLF_14270, partial [Solirubrobacteraceae bacterium]
MVEPEALQLQPNRADLLRHRLSLCELDLIGPGIAKAKLQELELMRYLPQRHRLHARCIPRRLDLLTQRAIGQAPA